MVWGKNSGALPQVAFQRRENIVYRHLAHTWIDLVTPLVGRSSARTSQYFERAPVGAVAPRIGGAEDGDSRLTERRSQVQWTAVHPNHRPRAAGCVDQSGQSGN